MRIKDKIRVRFRVESVKGVALLIVGLKKVDVRVGFRVRIRFSCLITRNLTIVTVINLLTLTLTLTLTLAYLLLLP